MSFFRHFLISVTIFAIFAAAYTTPSLIHTQRRRALSQEEIQFKKILATISDPELHDALEKYIFKKYRPAGVYENTTDDANQFDIIRRQNSNSTTTPTTSSGTTTLGPTTNDDTIVVPPTSSITSDTSQPDTPTTTPSTPDPTSPPSTSPPITTTIQSISSTDSPSTDINTRQSSTTKTEVYTTVQPDGSVITVTTYTIVPAVVPTSSDEPTKTPTLQGAAVRFDGIRFVGYAFILFAGLVVAL